MLQKDAFDFKGSNAIARALDNVVVAPNVPEVAIFVFPSSIACVIPAIADGCVGLFRVAIIAHHNTVGACIHSNADFTRFPCWAGGIIGMMNFNFVLRHRFAHAA